MVTTKGIGFTKHTDEQVIEALKATHGLISLAAKTLGLSSSGGLRTRIKNNPVLNEALKEARETVIDLAESGMIKKLEAEDANMIQFALRHLGASRGYIDSTHFSVDANVRNENVDLENIFSVEELREMNERISKGTNQSNNDSESIGEE